ncbi:DUF4105 domain-containing protein [Roseovarius sp. EL26]|uniref:Lnb N-terminal periplasmic domain-containing protein n=1 Tax=Roseovarius sp. EL26 TaxID=2126672 RepID=UPI000EA0BCFC|nr:DUF4105 domain-containing protein [Roseovarius sp. EL26]
MIKILKIVFKISLLITLLIMTVWGSMALWYRLPGYDQLRTGAAAVFALTGLVTILAQFSSKSTQALAGFGVAFCVLLFWWQSIDPPKNGGWAPDVARQVTGEISGDIVTLTNVREFEWRSPEDFTENWTTREFDLSKIDTLDVFMSYWDSPNIAHIIVSFGFSDGQYLSWSVEVRRKIDSGFSPIADFFKEHTLATVASVEQDVVGLRSNIRKEDVQLYRMNIPASPARALFEQYVSYSNHLSANAQWYNSVTTNCTTVIYQLLDAAGIKNKFDWRILINGFLPEYFYERGIVQTALPLAELRELGRIAPRANDTGLVQGFSTAIRIGVPTPH